MSRVIVSPSGRAILVEDHVSDEDALASIGEPPDYPAGPGPEGAGYKGGFLDYMQQGLGGLVQTAGSLVNPVLPGGIGAGIEDVGYGLQERNPYAGRATGLIDAMGKGEFGSYAGYLAASQVPNLLGLGASAYFGGPAGAAAYASALHTGSIIGRQEAKDADVDVGTALAYGIPLGLLETSTGVGGTVARVAGGGAGRLGTMALPKLGLSILGGAATEAGQEAVTEFGERYAVGEDLWTPEAQAAYRENAAAGALLGGPFGALEHAGARRRPIPVSDQPGQPTDILNPPRAPPETWPPGMGPFNPANLPATTQGFTMEGGPYTPGAPPPAVPGQLGLPGQRALPAPEPMPLLEATSPFARAAPGTQMPLPLEGGVAQQQLRLPMDIPQRAGPPGTQLDLPMAAPMAAQPPSRLPEVAQWEQPQLPLGRGITPPPAGPLFGEGRTPPPAPPASPAQQLELPGVAPATLLNPDVVRALIGGRDRPIQSAKWINNLSDRLATLARTGDLRGITSEIDRLRSETEASKSSEKTVQWRMAALARADAWLDQLRNVPPEAAPRETLAQPEPTQLEMPLEGGATQPQQMGLPLNLPARSGMATTMPAMGTSEAVSGPRERLPEIEAWRQPELPFEGRRPAPPGAAGPLFEPKPAPPKPPAPKTPKQPSLPGLSKYAVEKAKRDARRAEREATQEKARLAMEERQKQEAAEKKARIKEQVAAAKAKGRAKPAPKPEPKPEPKSEPKSEPASELDAKVDAYEEKLFDLETDGEKRAVRSFVARLQREGVLDAKDVAEVNRILKDRDMDVEDATSEIRSSIQQWAEEQRKRTPAEKALREKLTEAVRAPPEPEPVTEPPPPEPKPAAEPTQATAKKATALKKQVAAAKAQADADERSAPLRSIASDLHEEGVLSDEDFAAFKKAQRQAPTHDILADLLTGHIDTWAQETKAAPAAPAKAAAPAVAPEKISEPTPKPPTSPTKATETVTPIERAVEVAAEAPKVEKLASTETARFMVEVLPDESALFNVGEKMLITQTAARPDPDFDKLREHGRRKFSGAKQAAWLRMIDGVEKLHTARVEKTEARRPTKRGGLPKQPKEKPDTGPSYLKELGAAVLRRGAVFLRGDNLDNPSSYDGADKRAKARLRVIRLRQDRNHFTDALKAGPGASQRLNTGVESYLSETPLTNSDPWTLHGWNLAHLYQYGYVLPRYDPDAVVSAQPIDKDTVRAQLATYTDAGARADAATGISAALGGLAVPTNINAREGAAWAYSRVLNNRYFLDAKARSEEAAARAKAEREQQDEAARAAKPAKRGRGRPRKDGLGPGGFGMRAELHEKQGTDFTRRGFLQGVSAAALVGLAKPVLAKGGVVSTTARHPELVKLLEGGKAKEGLQWIASNSSSQFYRKLAKSLMAGKGGFDSVTLYSDANLNVNRGLHGLTQYRDGALNITLDAKTGTNEATFLHEMAHAWVWERWGPIGTYLPANKELVGDVIDREDAAVAEFIKIWRSVSDGLTKNLKLGTDEGYMAAYIGTSELAGTPDEAFSWLLTDEKLRTYLRSVDPEGNPTTGKSALYQLIDWLLRQFGMQPTAEDVTAFDALMEAADNLLDRGAQVAPDFKFYKELAKKAESSAEMRATLMEQPRTGGRSDLDGFGMFAGPVGAKASKAGVASLRLARGMENKGDVAHFDGPIQHLTGWFKTHEKGLWTFEISDHDMRIKVPSMFMHDAKGRVPLEMLIDHPDLFAAYPQLKDLEVVFDPKMSRRIGYYLPIIKRSEPMSSGANARNEVGISTRPGISTATMRSSLLHEVQHAVQDLEGQLRRRRPSFGTKVISGTGVLNRLDELAESLERDDNTEAMGKDLRTAVDDVKRVVEAAGADPELQPYLKGTLDTAPNYYPILQHAMYELDIMEMQARQTQARAAMTPQQRKAWNPNKMGISGNMPMRTIGAAFDERKALGEPFQLKGDYPVSNTEADPETTKMRDTLADIIGKGKLPKDQRDLAAQLGPLVEGLDLHSGTGELSDGSRGSVTLNPDGTVSAQVGHHDDSEAVLHEALHSALLRRWGALKAKMKTGDKAVDDIVNRLEKLRKDAARLYNKAKDPAQVGEAIENIDEFIAYGRTSPEVQAWMRGKQSGGLWGGFVDTMRRILGLPPKYGPILNAMMRESNAMLGIAERTAPKTAKAMAELAKSDDPVKLMLRGARTRMAADPVRWLNERTEPILMGTYGRIKTKLPSYAAIRADLYDMLARRMERAGISSDPVKKLARLIASRDAIRVRGEQEVADLNRAFLRLPEDERRSRDDKGKVNALIEKMTRVGEWGFMPDWLEPADASRVKVNPELEKQFKALSPEGQTHVQALLKAMYNKDVLLRSITTELVNAAYADELKAAKTDVERQKVQNEINAELKQVMADYDRSLPYAPLRRSGEWAVEAMSKEYVAAKKAGDHKKLNVMKSDENHYLVDFAQSEAEAEAMRRAVMNANPAFAPEQGGVATRKEANGLQEQFYGGRGHDMPQAFQRVMSKVEGMDEIKDGLRTQLRNIARQLYLRSLSDQNARKGALRRFGVASLPLDMQLNVEQHLKSQSYNLAAIQRNEDILKAFNQIKDTLDDLKTKPDDFAHTSVMFNEIVTRYVNSMQPPAEGMVARSLERVRRFASFWQLSTSPSFLTQQVTQPVMMTAPMLEGRYGLKEGAAAMANAYRAIDMAALGRAWRKDEGLSSDFVDPKYKKLLDYIADLGLLDVGISAETGKLPSMTGDNKHVRLVREWPRYIEFMNRAVSAIAPYELELKHPTGVAKPDAGAYRDYVANVVGEPMTEREFNSAYAAARLVQQTQGDYSTAAAPRFLQGPVGATVGQYRKIAIIVLSNYMRMIGSMADKSLPAEERAIAARSLAYSLGHVLVFTGISGLPGATMIFSLVNLIMWMFGDEDEPDYDVEQEIRKAINDPNLANLLLGGVPTAANLNLSSTLGQSQLLSIAPYQDLSLTRDDLLQYTGSVVAGPAFGMAISWLDGAGKIANDNMYKGIAQMLPRGLASTLSAYAEATQGIVSKSGELLQPAGEVGTTETVLRALGLQSVERVSRMERGEQAYDLRVFFEGRQRDIAREYTDALREGDTVTAAEARRKWIALQKVKVEHGRKPTPITSLLTAPRRRAQAEARARAGVAYGRGEEAFSEAQAALYGEDQGLTYSDEARAAAGGY